MSPPYRRRIAFVGNCQAAGLYNVYRMHLAPLVDDRADYIDLGRPDGVASDADVMVLQEFDDPQRLAMFVAPPPRLTIRFPTVMGGFYWPFCSQPHPNNAAVAGRFSGPYPAQRGDRFLNGLIRKGVGPEEALKIYEDTDIAAEAGVDRLFELGLQRQRRRDAAAGEGDVASLIEARFRSEPLFRTPDHPDLTVFRAVARRVYAALGFDDATVASALEALPHTPFPLAATPLHPRLIAHFGLTFADASTRYPFPHEGEFTFAEYVRRYMAFAWNPDLDAAIEETDAHVGFPKLVAALRGSPESSWGWVRLTAFLITLRRATEAQMAASQALRLAPREPEAWLALARAQLGAGGLVEAERSVEDALARFPAYAHAHTLCAELRLAQNRPNDALASARRAVALRPGDAHKHSFLAGLLLQAGAPAEAERCIRAAIRLEPENRQFSRFLANMTGRRALQMRSQAALRSGGD